MEMLILTLDSLRVQIPHQNYIQSQFKQEGTEKRVQRATGLFFQWGAYEKAGVADMADWTRFVTAGFLNVNMDLFPRIQIPLS